VDLESDTLSIFLSSVAGMILLLRGVTAEKLEGNIDLGNVFVLCLLLGPVFGWTALFVGSTLLAWVNERLGGLCDRERVRAAIGWSCVPVLWLQVLWLLLFWIPGIYWIMMVGSLWILYVFVVCLAIALRISIVRAIINLLLALALILIPLVISSVPFLNPDMG
jgi:Yip1 domain